MRFTLNYKKDTINSAQPYNTILRVGYFDVEKDVSNNKITVEETEYNLTKIWVDCVKHPINKRELNVSAIYFEHIAKKNPNDTSSPNKFVYVKIPVVVVDKTTAKTYPQLRKWIKDIHEGDVQTNPKINVSISNGVFNADETTKLPSNNNLGKIATNTFTFSNTISGTLSTVTNVGYIVELVPMNVPEAYKISVNDDAFDISVFTNTNVTTKNTPNNPNNNNTINSQTDVSKEGFAGLNDRIESFVEGLTCKRKAKTGVVNGTVMSQDFAEKLIESQTQIGIATIVMFFVSLLVITIVYLSAKSYEEYDVVLGPVDVSNTAKGGSRVGGQKGGGELCDINQGSLTTGYIMIVGISCFMLNLFGAVKLKQMYMLFGAIFFAAATGIYYYLYANHFSISEIELEHLILYNRKKPFVKWIAISGYYMCFALFFALVMNPKLSVTAFYTTQIIFIVFVIAAYFLWQVYSNVFVSSVITTNPDESKASFDNVVPLLKQITNYIFNFPLLLVLGSSFITNLTLTM